MNEIIEQISSILILIFFILFFLSTFNQIISWHRLELYSRYRNILNNFSKFSLSKHFHCLSFFL